MSDSLLKIGMNLFVAISEFIRLFIAAPLVFVGVWLYPDSLAKAMIVRLIRLFEINENEIIEILRELDEDGEEEEDD